MSGGASYRCSFYVDTQLLEEMHLIVPPSVGDDVCIPFREGMDYPVDRDDPRDGHEDVQVRVIGRTIYVDYIAIACAATPDCDIWGPIVRAMMHDRRREVDERLRRPRRP